MQQASDWKASLTKAFARGFPDAGEPIALSVAPGRIEVLGNHTDYNGGEVLGAAVDRQLAVAVGQRTDRAIHLMSGDGERKEPVVLSLDRLEPVAGTSPEAWTNYPVGVLVELIRAGMTVDRGFNILVLSDLDPGAGLSSSAALELSAALALASAASFSLKDRAQLARLGRRAENGFVGVPCGILDQGVSAFGQKDALVHIDCDTEVFSTSPLPPRMHFWVFNSGKKHALIDSMYSQRHEECMNALQVLRGFFPEITGLCSLKPAQLAGHRVDLPAAAFKRAHHVVHENGRVQQAVTALEDGDLDQLGRLLSASHESSRDFMENSTPELDFLVGQLTGRPGVIGARLTGGGFGGAVLALTDDTFGKEDANAVMDAYRVETGVKSRWTHMITGPGAQVIHGLDPLGGG
ncbi:MAG: galactokinase [Opitutales bacterium]